MARNRLSIDRDAKKAEILEAARRLFLHDGYEATSMSRLAHEAGIASNTIYWYFEDKDEVLLAVLDLELAEAARAYHSILEAPFADRLEWLVGRLRGASRLVTTVHARVALSARVQAWHEGFHEHSEAMLRAELETTELPAERVEAIAKLWVFTVEGLLAHPLDPSKQRAVCEELAQLAERAPRRPSSSES